jgi:hypothetical protein
MHDFEVGDRVRFRTDKPDAVEAWRRWFRVSFPLEEVVTISRLHGANMIYFENGGSFVALSHQIEKVKEKGQMRLPLKWR